MTQDRLTATRGPRFRLGFLTHVQGRGDPATTTWFVIKLGHPVRPGEFEPRLRPLRTSRDSS